MWYWNWTFIILKKRKKNHNPAWINILLAGRRRGSLPVENEPSALGVLVIILLGMSIESIDLEKQRERN